MRAIHLQDVRGGLVRLEVVALASALALAGCYKARSLDDEKTDVALAELMADGKLPPTMQPGPDSPDVPPRFCGGGGGDEDGGVDMPGPVSGPGTGPMVGIPRSGSGASMPPAMLAAINARRAPLPNGTGSDASGSGTSGGSSSGEAGGGMTGGMGGSPSVSDGGVPVGSGSCESFPIGFWRFDDCSRERTDLSDSSNQGHSAFRNVDLQCVPGQEGQAVSLANAGDLVYAPDQPDFALSEGVTVAAWVKPDRLDGVQTIFRKRDDDNSAFTLLLNGRRFQFIVKLASGRLASVSAPAQARAWTHVAATYDGTYLSLYKNGSLVSQTRAVGQLTRGLGPLLMGNDIKERRLRGLMDNAWFNTLAAPADTIMRLTCLHRPPELAITPATSDPVEAGTTVHYELSITNKNTPTCDPAEFAGIVQTPEGFGSDQGFGLTPSLSTDETSTVAFDVSSGEETEGGTYTIDFRVFTLEDFQQVGNIQAEYVVVEPTGCHVSSARELTIRDVSVVDDPVRTSLDGDPSDPRTGAWTFGRMMERLSATPEDAPDVTEDMFRSFLSTQQINGFSVEPRDQMDPIVLQPWPRTADGKLDLARAPLRLLAIVNRLDLERLEQGKAGEGRIVYGVLDESGNQMEFTVILEYLLPANSEAELKQWADAFHGLQALPFPSEEYNAALQAITDRFSARNAIPTNPNGSALIDIRTNEIALSFEWQLREFHLSSTDGLLHPATIFLTPDLSFNGSAELGRFINDNESTILTETHDVPVSFEGAPFLGGAVINDGFTVWDAPGINNPEARHKFALNTCNGCHGSETQTGFLQIFPRDPGQQSSLSGFLIGETVNDPVTGESRRLAELKRRRELLQSVVCPQQP